MAESAVGIVINKLISLLTEEANLLRGVHREVEGIKIELQNIQVVLKDADQRAKSEGDKGLIDGVKLWVEELREAAFEIEDAIDKYTQHIAQKREKSQGERSQRLGFLSFLRKTSLIFPRLKPRHDVASSIQDIKKRVEEINKRSSTYGFTTTQQGSLSSVFDARSRTWSDPREDSRFLEEAEVVGIEADRDELLERLKSGSPQRSVIALVGMPGIGKTTLAHQIYERAKEKFDCHAWISVSQSYNKFELLRSLVKKFCQSRKESVPEGIDQETDHYTLATNVKDYLQGKSYFITFDDVWDTNFWAGIKNALPKENENRGRIIITTRNVKVGESCKMSALVHIHQLKLLSFKNSRELFCKKAFHSDPEKACPAFLEGLCREIVERCQGLPLAIVVIGGLLATKNNSVGEWGSLLNGLSSELGSNEHLESIDRILSLSYNDLPYYLKSCFLYLGIFPEDYSIRSRRLVRQWIAEGFVKPQKDRTLEAVGEEYLAELMSRSMVQVSKADFYGNAKSCRIHDVVREFILKNMEDLKFCKNLPGNDSNDFGRLTARRISFHDGSNVSSRSSNIPETSRIRSIFVFDKEEILNPLVRAISSNLKLLKVLDFEDCRNLDLLPDDIGNLFHLRYLSVRGTSVTLLPKSIEKLENLETLDLKHSSVYELPAEVNKLRKLRHLLAYHHNSTLDYSSGKKRGVKIQKGFGNLKSLQTLYMVEANVEGVDVIEELSKLTELRKLVISKLRSEDKIAMSGCLHGLKRLESFKLYSANKDEAIDFEFVSSPPQSLRRIFLHGRLKNFPKWISELQSLVRLRIHWSRLKESPLKSLGNLPNLLEVSISSEAFYGEKLVFEEGDFPKLKVLYLRNLSRLNSLVIEKGTLPNLENFEIGPCPKLKEIPSGFRNLPSLKVLKFMKMPFLLFQNFENVMSVPEFKFVITFNGKRSYLGLNQVLEIQNHVREHDEVDWKSLSYEEIIGELFESGT